MSAPYEIQSAAAAAADRIFGTRCYSRILRLPAEPGMNIYLWIHLYIYIYIYTLTVKKEPLRY